MKIKINAGFWIRFLAGFIDALTFLFFGYLLSIMTVSKEIKIIDWAYYVWMCGLGLIIVILQIGIPMTNKKRMTLGRLICRLEILSKEDKSPTIKNMLKKETIYSLIWLLCFLMFILFISPELFEKMAKNSEIQITKNPIFTNKELAIISIPVSMITLLNFVQFVLTLSILRKSRISFNDYFSDTKTVWTNKYYQPKKQQQIYSLPKKLPKLEWIN